MKNYLAKIGKSLRDGFYSVAKGMSTFSIYPEKYKIPSDWEAWEENGKNMRSDWKAVGNDLKNAIRSLDSVLQKNPARKNSN